jgi:hypothetical protein
VLSIRGEPLTSQKMPTWVIGSGLMIFLGASPPLFKTVLWGGLIGGHGFEYGGFHDGIHCSDDRWDLLKSISTASDEILLHLMRLPPRVHCGYRHSIMILHPLATHTGATGTTPPPRRSGERWSSLAPTQRRSCPGSNLLHEASAPCWGRNGFAACRHFFHGHVTNPPVSPFLCQVGVHSNATSGTPAKTVRID